MLMVTLLPSVLSSCLSVGVLMDLCANGDLASRRIASNRADGSFGSLFISHVFDAEQF
jgi:hypothetical protein